jgi:hypothetical protein
VHEALDVAGGRAGRFQCLAYCGEHPLRLVARRGRRLARDQPVAGQQGSVREGAADVHPEDHRGGR